MNQMTLDLMTAEEAHKRIFSMKEPPHKAWEDPDEIIADQMRQITASSLDLSHIDEPGTEPTRAPYQWVMDMVLWNSILYTSETDEGYPFVSPQLSSCYLAKLEVLSEKCRPDRYLRADGKERWPRMPSDSHKPTQIADWTILEALMGDHMVHCGSFPYASQKIVKILDNLLPDASVPLEDAARAMTTLLSHYGYHSGYPEPIQASYGMKDLARLMKRACPALTTAHIVIPDAGLNTRYPALWARDAFAPIKSILDSPPNIEATPASRKCSP